MDIETSLQVLTVAIALTGMFGGAVVFIVGYFQSSLGIRTTGFIMFFLGTMLMAATNAYDNVIDGAIAGIICNIIASAFYVKLSMKPKSSSTQPATPSEEEKAALAEPEPTTAQRQ